MFTPVTDIRRRPSPHASTDRPPTRAPEVVRRLHRTVEGGVPMPTSLTYVPGPFESSLLLQTLFHALCAAGLAAGAPALPPRIGIVLLVLSAASLAVGTHRWWCALRAALQSGRRPLDLHSRHLWSRGRALPLRGDDLVLQPVGGGRWSRLVLTRESGAPLGLVQGRTQRVEALHDRLIQRLEPSRNRCTRCPRRPGAAL